MNKLFWGLFLLVFLIKCGAIEEAKEHIENIDDLSEVMEQLGVEGVEAGDIELAVSEIFEEDFSAELGELSLETASFADFSDGLEDYIVPEGTVISETEAAEDPTKSMLTETALDDTVGYVLTTCSADDKDAISEENWQNCKMAGDTVVQPDFRKKIFKLANENCPDKDDDLTTISVDEVRCLLVVLTIKKVKPYYKKIPADERNNKRQAKRLKMFKNKRKQLLGGKDVEKPTPEQIKKIQSGAKTQKTKRKILVVKAKKVRKQRQEYRKANPPPKKP